MVLSSISELEAQGLHQISTPSTGPGVSSVRTDRDIICAAPYCTPSTYNGGLARGGTPMFVTQTEPGVAKAPMLNAEIAKPPQHTEYLVGEKADSVFPNKQSCPRGQGTKGPGTHWFPTKPNGNRRWHRLSLRAHRRLLSEETGEGRVPPQS